MKASKLIHWGLLILLCQNCTRPLSVNEEAVSVPVVFTCSLPASQGTKAVSDGLSASTLLLYTYDANGTYLPALAIEKPGAFESRTATANLALVKGMTYNFVFVAISSNATPAYTVDAASGTLAIDYSALTANDDAYDIFTASLADYKVTGSFTETVTLKRPIAQVNVGVPVADYTVAANSGIKVDEITSSFVFSEAGTAYDILHQKVTTNADAAVTVPAKIRPVDEDLTVGTDTYKYMAMSYILVPMDGVTADNRATLTSVDLSLNVETTSGATSTLTRSVVNVPVQKNWRTNILGNIFGIAGVFNIIIDEIYAGDINITPEGGSDTPAGNVDVVPVDDWGTIN